MATLQQEAQSQGATTVAKVAHKLEVLVIPVSDGGSTPTTTTAKISA
jgi:hypothetical protein